MIIMQKMRCDYLLQDSEVIEEKLYLIWGLDGVFVIWRAACRINVKGPVNIADKLLTYLNVILKIYVS